MLFDISHLGEIGDWKLENRNWEIVNKPTSRSSASTFFGQRKTGRKAKRKRQSRSRQEPRPFIQFLSVALPFAFCALHFDLLFGPGGLAKPRGHSQLLVSIV
jgi:hypothetical protein